MKFGKGTGGVKKGKLSDLEKHNKDLRAKKEEVEIDELSKKTLGSYVKKAATDKANAAMDLQRSTDRPGRKQTRKDVDTHVGKMIKRDKGINKAVDKLSKESKETENGERDMGSDAYANYVSNMTPGQGIDNKDAKKADARQKKEKAMQNHQLNTDEAVATKTGKKIPSELAYKLARHKEKVAKRPKPGTPAAKKAQRQRERADARAKAISDRDTQVSGDRPSHRKYWGKESVDLIGAVVEVLGTTNNKK